MDIFLTLLGFVFVCLGLAGSFLPILPGALTGWIGLFVLYLSKSIPSNWTFLGVTLAIALLVFFLDYIIPMVGTKKFGGTKYGIIGTSLGLIIGILAPIPFGIIIGPFVGAIIGEMINDNTNQNKAFKAAFGSFLGLLTSTFIKFNISSIFFGLYIVRVWEYRDVLF